MCVVNPSLARLHFRDIERVIVISIAPTKCEQVSAGGSISWRVTLPRHGREGRHLRNCQSVAARVFSFAVTRRLPLRRCVQGRWGNRMSPNGMVVR
jgi:hypothetical protein